MREYVDKQAPKGHKIRKRVIDNTEFAPGENEAPHNAPDWTKSGYNGSLIESVELYSGVSCLSPPPEENNDKNSEEQTKEHQDKEENEKKDEEENEKEDEEENEKDKYRDPEENKEGNESEESGSNRINRSQRSQSIVSYAYDSEYEDDSD